MARRTVVTIVDDLDGKALKDAVTVNFTVDGKQYEFDTSPSNATQFHRDLERYIVASRSTDSRSVVPRSARATKKVIRARRSGRDTQAMRTWARDNGYEISDRGRISVEIIEAYDAAN
ncbi:histone-like nucleoid-structuring protein Lsr2 [Gordonia sp. NPDC003376]